VGTVEDREHLGGTVERLPVRVRSRDVAEEAHLARRIALGDERHVADLQSVAAVYPACR